MTNLNIEVQANQNSYEPTDEYERDVFSQMRAIGINPDTLLEIAAHDLINQYGDDALIYSREVEQQYSNNQDEQALQIWQRITAYLQSLNGDGSLIAH